MFRIQIFIIALMAATLMPSEGLAANRRQNYNQLTAESDKVVIGSVGVRNSYWGEDSRIYSDVIISPDVTIKGAEEGAIVVQVLGGTIGDTTMTVHDGPELPEGQRVVVFLKREKNRFVVSGRAAGSVSALSLEATDALDGAFTSVEKVTGSRMVHKRNLAKLYRDQVVNSTVATAAAQVGCYIADEAKWPTDSATYKIGTSIPASWTSSVDASANTWSGAGAAFRLINNANSVNELSYLDLVAKYGASYANTYAVTTTWWNTTDKRIIKATIEINTKWQWSTSGEVNMADVQNILTHEFGHWMRLLDIYSPSTCGEVTMWGSATMGETKKRTLDQADIDGFRSLYGTGSGTTTVGVATLTAPANGATNVSNRPTLSWTAASNATSYDIYFGTTSTPGLVATVSSTSYLPGSLTAGTTYYWRVLAKGSSGSNSSAIASFTVTPPAAIGPTLITPANGATGVPLSALFQWSAVPHALAYDVYIGESPAPGKIGSINSTSATISGMRSRVVYYWKIVAQTSNGSVSSDVGSFTTN